MKFLERALDNQSQAWKYIITLIVSFLGGSIIGSIPLIAVMVYAAIKNGTVPNTENIYDFASYGLSQNSFFFLMILPFVFSLAILLFLNKVLHKRSYTEIINGRKNVRWKRFISGAIFWLILSGVSLSAGYALDPSNFVFQFELSSFLPLLVITLVMIPLQTSYEEMAFRGYMAQGVAAVTRNRWWVLIIPSVTFGLLHSFNPEVAEHGFWIMMPQYILFGLIFGIISILDDGIELAMGVHAANNVFAALFVTNSSSVFQTPAVFNMLVVDPKWGIVELLVLGGIMFAFFYKKYNWSFSVMNRPVEKETTITEDTITDQQEPEQYD